MKSEYLKQFTAIISLTVAVTVFLKSSSLFESKIVTLATIGAAAYAAFFSLYLSKRLERKRIKQRIFIIYSHKDSEQAEKITEELKNLGYNPWFDQQEIMPGQRWTKAINQGIEESAVALFLSSKNTEKGEGFLKNEMKAATDVLRARSDTFSPVIPVFLEESSLPEELKGIHAVKYYEDSGLENLNRGLQHIFKITS